MYKNKITVDVFFLTDTYLVAIYSALFSVIDKDDVEVNFAKLNTWNFTFINDDEKTKFSNFLFLKQKKIFFNCERFVHFVYMLVYQYCNFT